MKISKLFLTLLLGSASVFVGCEKTETAQNEARTFENFQEFKEWAGDRLVVDSEKSGDSFTIDGEDYSGTYYIYAQNENQRIFAIDEEQAGEKKSGPYYYHTYSAGAGFVSCDGRAKDCNGYSDGDVVVIVTGQ